MDDRTRILSEIATLARQHGLSAQEIAAVLGAAPTPARETRWRGVLVHVLGILGGTFVFAGIGVFVALQWDDMNSSARVVVTLGSGLVAFVLAVLSVRDMRFEKLTPLLFLMAAVLEPTGMLVAFEEFGSGGDWRWASLAVTGTMTLQFAAAFRAVRQSTPLFTCIAFGALFWWTACDLVGMDETLISIVLGAGSILIAAAVDRTRHRAMAPVWYLIGGVAFLYGFFDVVDRTPFEISFLAVAAGFVYLSVVLRSRTLLAVGALAVLAYTAWFTGQHFADSLGWPLLLILLGMVMIGLSALAFRIDRDYLRGKRLLG